MTTSDLSPSNVRVTLNNVEMWQKFYPRNEMVVTRAGRKLFPDLEVTIEGLNPDALYTVHFYLERVNNIKYHFNRNSGTGEWEEVGPVKDTPVIVKKPHNRGGLVGSAWMEAPVSFSHIYITNDTEFQQKPSKTDRILVQSMHKYQPMITVKRVCDGYEEYFRLTMTEFMVVTAYQDAKIIELKKQNNKYANGFRLEGKHVKRPQDETPRRGKRVAPCFETPASKMMTPPSLGQNYFQTPSTPSGPPPQNFHQSYQMMTPTSMAMTPSTMITPPSMGATPPTPLSVGSQNFQNPMCAMPPPAPPAYYNSMQPDWSQYGAYNMAEEAPQGKMNQGVDDFQNFQQFGNYGYPPYDGAGTSGSNASDFDFRF